MNRLNNICTCQRKRSFRDVLCCLFRTYFEWLWLRLLSLEQERLLWPPRELWESGHSFCGGLLHQEVKKKKRNNVNDWPQSHDHSIKEMKSKKPQALALAPVFRTWPFPAYLWAWTGPRAGPARSSRPTGWTRLCVCWSKSSSLSIRTQRNLIILIHVENLHVVPGSIAAAMVDWASLTLFITISSSLAAACGVSSGGFTMALLEWLTLKDVKEVLVTWIMLLGDFNIQIKIHTSAVCLQTWLHWRSGLWRPTPAQQTLRRRNASAESHLQPSAQTLHLPPAWRTPTAALQRWSVQRKTDWTTVCILWRWSIMTGFICNSSWTWFNVVMVILASSVPDDPTRKKAYASDGQQVMLHNEVINKQLALSITWQ